MGLLEILITLFGPALARMMLIRWLNDSDIAEELTGSLKGIVSRFVSDVRAQQKANRLFTEIGEEVAESLFRIFQMEGVELADERQEAVARAVADTLPSLSVETSLQVILIQHNLQPDLLSNFLIRTRPHRQILDPLEQDLYERIVSEACQRILRIVVELPSFQLESLAEILRRSRELEDTARQALSKIDQLYNFTFSQFKDISLKVKRFEHEYREAVEWQLDKVELFGLEVKGNSSRKQPLSVAYVTLKLAERYGKSSDTPVALADRRNLIVRGEAGSGKTTILQWIAVRAALSDFSETAPEMLSWHGTIPFFIRLRDFAKPEVNLPSPEMWPGLIAPHLKALMPEHWVHEQLTNGNAIVLIDGLDEVSETKQQAVIGWLTQLVTTFRNAHFIVSSRPEAAKELSQLLWPETLEFPGDLIETSLLTPECADLINLSRGGSFNNKIRQLIHQTVSKILSNLENDWRNLAEARLKTHITFSSEYSIAVLTNGELDLEIDGRPQVIRIRFTKLEGVRVLLTTIMREWFAETRNIWRGIFDVLPMSDDAIQGFVWNWHRAVMVAEGNLPDQNEELENLATNLVIQLRDQLQLRSLVTNPLLCAMLCALHRERKQKIPDDRINLYKSCIFTLLRRRDESRGVDVSDYPELNENHAYLLVKDLAYWMMRNGYVASAPKDKVEGRLNTRLNQIIGIKPTTGKEALRYLVERSGIIREPIPETIDFAHRTFQEFLAADDIVSESDMRVLHSHVYDQEWREIIVLTAGLAPKQELDWIFDTLLWEIKDKNASKYKPSRQRYLSFIALDCLGVVLVLTEVIKANILKHLEMAKPPKSDEELRGFLNARELAIPFLKYHVSYSKESLYLCVTGLLTIAPIDQAAEIAQIIQNPFYNKELTHNSLLELAYSKWEIFEFPKLYAKIIVQTFLDESRSLSLSKPEYIEIALTQLILSHLYRLHIRDCRKFNDWDGFAKILSNLPKLELLALERIDNILVLEPLFSLPNVRKITVGLFAPVTRLPEFVLKSNIQLNQNVNLI